MPDSNGDRYVTNARLHDKLDEVYEVIETQGKEVTKHGVYLKILLVVTPLTATFGPDLARALT